jgi:hypothetical protein
MRVIFAAVLAAALAPPSFAQTQQSEFERYAIIVGTPCLQSTTTPDTAADAIAKCDKAAADLVTLKAAVPDLAGYDLNVFHIVRGTMFTRLANANMQLHGAKSQQVCGSLESAWTHFSAFTPDSSPSYAGTARTMIDAAVREVKVCRDTFGTPQGAAPL